MFHFFVAGSRFGNLVHTVKTGVACQRALRDAVALKQLQRFFVLHEKVGESKRKLFSEEAAVPFEEVLVGAENGGENVGGYVFSSQNPQVVKPELIFHEEYHFGVSDVDQAAYFARQVGWQVAHCLGLCVIFADFVPRGGEEGDQHLMSGMQLAIGLDDGSSLLEFAEACRMKPCRGASRLQLHKLFLGFSPSFHHQPCVAVTKESRQTYAQRVEPDSYSV